MIARERSVKKPQPTPRAAGLAAVVLVAVSTAGNLVLGAYETATAHPYGERVTMDGQVNISGTGDGEQTMVLLSGYGTASPVLDFTPLIGELEDDYSVVVIERFGDGYSDRMSLSAPLRTSPELHETLSLLGVKDSYVLVAHFLAGI